MNTLFLIILASVSVMNGQSMLAGAFFIGSFWTFHNNRGQSDGGIRKPGQEYYYYEGGRQKRNLERTVRAQHRQN